MAKITLDSMSVPYTTLLNSNFSSIANEFQNKVLYRNNPAGEVNSMQNDLDMNSNDILNTNRLETTSLKLNGSLVSTVALTANDSALIQYDQGSTGSVVTNAEKKFQEVLSVKDFGAVGDGATDDSAAIQAAIDAASTIAAAKTRGGVVVYFPGSEYLVNTTLTLTQDYVYLRGDGKHLSALITTNSASNIITVGKTASAVIVHVGFEGLSFETRGNATSGTTVKWTNVLDGVMKDVGIFGWWDGLELVGCNRCFFSQIFMSQSGRSAGRGNDGIRQIGTTAAGVCSDIHYTDVQIIDASTGSLGFEDCIRIKSSDGTYMENCHLINADICLHLNPDDVEKNDTVASILVSNCYFDQTDATTGLNGVRLDGSATLAYRDIQFSNCIWRDSKESAIEFATTTLVSMVTFNGCVIRDNGKSGIFTTTTNQEHIVVSGCMFSGNNTDADASSADIWARGAYWNISGCNFRDGNAAGRGVALLSNSSNSILSSSNFSDSTAGIKVSETGTGNRLHSLVGFVIKNKGFATITNPATSVVVAHGLGITPSQADINVVLTNLGAGTTRFWVDTVGATNFTLNVDTTPTTNAQFAWNVESDT